jgi:hypothetical protein
VGDAIIKAKNYLNVTGYLLLRVHGEYRVMYKFDSKAEKFKTDDELIAFARKKGWKDEG